MTKYDSYKDSGVIWVNEIPNHWNTNKFKYIFKEKKSTSNPSLNSGSISFGEVVYKDDESIPESTKLSYQEVLEGEFLINPLNLNYDLKSLRTSLSGINVVVSQGYIVLQLVTKDSKGYFKYLLREFDIQHLKSLGNGVRQTISFNHLSIEELPLPPLNEQQQIVSFLDTKTSLIDSLIEKTQRKIELLKDSIPNYHFYTNEKNQFVEMKKYWFQKKPSEWRILKLREIFDIISERNHPNERLLSVHQIKGVIYRDEQSQDVMNPSGDISNYKLVKPGDFIISLRSSEGGFEYSEVTGLVSPVYTVLRPKFEIDTVFYKYLFKTHNFIVELNRFIKGIRDGKNINFIDIRDVLVPVPLEFNYKVHQTHLNILKSFSLEEKRIELLKEYRQSLISEVVTGKLKVTTDE
jgi:type I restriction enzyme, S subunit